MSRTGTPLAAGADVVLDIEKPVVGGRMLARHEGQVVLTWGAVPGEQVRARIERAGKGVAYADVVEVLTASPDRRETHVDWRCGGNVLAHVAYARQLSLKAQIIADAFARIGRLALPLPEMVLSPEQGYRMRARLHARHGRVGFFREGTHRICDVAGTGQLRTDTAEWVAAAAAAMEREGLTGVTSIELAENIAGDQRACHLQLAPGERSHPYAVLTTIPGISGLSTQTGERPRVELLSGSPAVSDTLQIREGDPGSALVLTRDVRAFFQGNRFLLETLVRHVVAQVPEGPVVDLYAGVGLFGLALAATRDVSVTLVEGDRVSGADLERNALPFPGRVTVVRRSVEAFLQSAGAGRRDRAVSTGGVDLSASTVIVDPPRTGISREALGGIIAGSPARIVYVSCDVATLARDARLLLDAGYELERVTGFDLFPNTAHVETVAVFARSPLP